MLLVSSGERYHFYGRIGRMQSFVSFALRFLHLKAKLSSHLCFTWLQRSIEAFQRHMFSAFTGHLVSCELCQQKWCQWTCPSASSFWFSCSLRCLPLPFPSLWSPRASSNSRNGGRRSTRSTWHSGCTCRRPRSPKTSRAASRRIWRTSSHAAASRWQTELSGEGKSHWTKTREINDSLY